VPGADGDLVAVGRIGPAHGLRGEVLVAPFTDEPDERFAPGAVLVAEPGEAGPLTVESARWQGKRLVVRFTDDVVRNVRASDETFRPLAGWNKGITHTAWILLAGQLVFMWNFFASLVRGAPAPANPWQVGTLEWTHAASPPAPHNFAEIPTVLHGPHEFNHPQLTDKDWLGQAERLPGDE